MKKKVILSSVLTIVLCLSLIGGATFALFTSESTVNVAITSGKVDVQATILEDTLATSSLGVEQKAGYFANGGTALFDSAAKLELTNITPGDQATFTIEVRNNSNVTVQYRVKWAVDGELYDALVATADGEAIVNNTTDWVKWEIPATEEEKVKTIDVSVLLPKEVGNKYQEKTASVAFTVEAIQGNAIFETVTTEEQLAVALEVGNNAKLGADITLTNGLTIPADKVFAIDLNGHTISNPITVDSVPAGVVRNVIMNNGTLSIVGPGTVTAAATYSLNNNGTLTVTDATVSNGGIYNTGDLTINSATIKESITGRHAIYHGGTSLVINGGTFEANAGNELINAGADNVTINGGTFTMTGASYLFGPQNAGIVINGGTFNGYVNETGSNDKMRPGAAVVNGGTFNFDPTDWINTTYFEVATNEDGTYTVNPKAGVTVVKSAKELLALANKKLTGTILLVNDIDLAGASLQSLASDYGKELTVVGDGHTISNVKLVTNTHNGMGNYGLFYAYTNSKLTVSDLMIENVTFEGATAYGHAAVVVGYADGGSEVTLTNVDVVNATVVNPEATAENGAIYVGYTTGKVTLTNCDIASNCSVTGFDADKTGAFVGTANTTGCVVTITNCTNNTAIQAIGRNYAGKANIIIDGVAIWSGYVVDSLEKSDDGYYHITSGAQLAYLNTILSGLPAETGIKVILENDIDLNNISWTPIGLNNPYEFAGTFDGNNHAIYNVKVDGEYENAGLFGYVQYPISVIKNLTVNGITVSGTSERVGGIAGMVSNAKIEKCHVVNAQLNVGEKVGGIVGDFVSSTLNDCTVTDSVVTSTECAGGIAGRTRLDGNAPVVTNCTATNVTVTGTAGNTGAVVGTQSATVDLTSNKAENCTCIMNATASDSASLNEALASGTNVNVTLAAGTYTIPSVAAGKTVTISGTKDTIVDITSSVGLNGGNITFDGVTVLSNDGGFANGIQHVDTVTYNNVKIVGSRSLYGNKEVFNNCVFDLTGIADYIWVYGANEAEFINCTFNTLGKAILIYNEGDGDCKVTVKGCTFNATTGAKAGDINNQNCAAIEIYNYANSGTGLNHTLITEGNTVDSDFFSGEWRIKNFLAGGVVTVNGVEYTKTALDGKLMTVTNKVAEFD